MKTAAVSFVALAMALASSGCSSPPSEGGSQDSELGHDAGRSDGGFVATAGDAGDAGTDAGAREAFVDPRDGQTYPTLRFGDAVWLGRNLSFEIEGSSFCYDDDERNCDADGRLYLWSAARTACPGDWHLASDEDWQALERSLGMKADQLVREGYATPRGTNEGTKLKSQSGFAARMAGYRGGNVYEALGDRTYFWTSSTRQGEVWRRRVAEGASTIFRFTNPPADFAISIRCVHD